METLDIQGLINQAQQEISKAPDKKTCEQIKLKYFGKKGVIADLMKSLKDVDPAVRPQLGKSINEFKQMLSNQLETVLSKFEAQETLAQLENEKIDVTQPGRPKNLGKRHILNQMLEQILEVWQSLGFSVQLAPDVESDHINFKFLNFPDNHPARDMQDTFYITDDHLLKTHATTIQGRIMGKHKPPIRVVSPGKCYRNESITLRSHVLFHQVDVLYVDKGVSFADLFSTLDQFCKRLFGAQVKTRFRASYFPFVEPGLEVDVSCLFCHGDGCQICKHTGWLEICGAGMVHPNVLKNGGLDPDEYSGFALGMGVERPALIRHGIGDIRLFMENDLRFLEQF